MEIKIWQLILAIIYLLWTIIALYTIFKNPKDLFEKEEYFTYDDYGVEHYPSKTPLTNAWISIHLAALIILILIYTPWSNTIKL